MCTFQLLRGIRNHQCIRRNISIAKPMKRCSILSQYFRPCHAFCRQRYVQQTSINCGCYVRVLWGNGVWVRSSNIPGDGTDCFIMHVLDSEFRWSCLNCYVLLFKWWRLFLCLLCYQIRSGNPRQGDIIFKVLFTLQRVRKLQGDANNWFKLKTNGKR